MSKQELENWCKCQDKYGRSILYCLINQKKVLVINIVITKIYTIKSALNFAIDYIIKREKTNEKNLAIFIQKSPIY